MKKIIDISYAQGELVRIPYKCDGVIVRCGYRGYGAVGTLQEDSRWQQNLKLAMDSGKLFGVYFFSQAITPKEGKEEADFALALMDAAEIPKNIPLWIDTEESAGYPNGRADKLDRQKRTAAISGFLSRVRQDGRPVGVYCSESWYSNNLFAEQLKDASGYWWIAQYSREPKIPYSIWQYGLENLDGIDMDVNHCPDSAFEKIMGTDTETAEYWEEKYLTLRAEVEQLLKKYKE